MKTHVSKRSASSTPRAEQAQRRSSGGQAALQLQASERMVAQRQQVEAAFGAAAQRVEPEEELQRKAVQLASPEEEEMPLQGRFATVQAKAEPNRTGMPDHLKSGIESLSGMDMSSVRVHANSDKPAQLNALAYAQGNDIHLAPGQEQHLPHEAWHVVQQRQGRVQPTTQMQGVGINDDHALESEADAMGARALSTATSTQGEATQRIEDKGPSGDRP